MALGANHLANSAASVQEFVPELWSDDILAAYKSNLVVANLVKKMNHVGKKGDTIHIPVPTRNAANTKAVETQVTLIQNNSSQIDIPLGAHYEYSVILEDILEVQALPSLRRFHTDDAGYALAKRIDTDLINTFSADENGISISSGAISGNDTTWAGAGTAQVYHDGGSGVPTDYVEASTAAIAVTDAFIRELIQILDDADTPMNGRCMVVTPGTKNELLGIDRYNSSDFHPNGGVKTGLVGDIYGAEVFVSSNLPFLDTNAERANLMFHKDAVCYAEQKSVRSQAQYKQEYLGTLLTSDCIYGTQKLRDEAGLAFVTLA